MTPHVRAHIAAWLLGLPMLAGAHEYYTKTFQIIHPWTQPALAGSPAVALYMRIIQIDEDDRLLSASSGVAERVELRLPMANLPEVSAAPAAPAAPVSAASPATRPGIALVRGREVAMSPFAAHLVLRGVNTQLHEGREYPLTLVFERAGEVEAPFVVGSH